MSEDIYKFTLFITDNEPNSIIARRNLDLLCDERLNGQFELEVTNVLMNAESAYEQGVVVTPTLLAYRGDRRIVIVGNLSNREKVCAALQLPESA